MKKRQQSWSAAGVLAAASLLAGTSAWAADTYTATIGADAEKVAFTHGFTWTSKPLEVSIGLFKATPNPAERARAMAHGGASFGVFEAPNARLDLTFKEGSTKADLASFESCHILFAEFKIGIYDLNSFSTCGPVELSGSLTAGGVIHAKLKGQSEAYPRNDGTRPVYTWDVDVTATLHPAQP